MKIMLRSHVQNARESLHANKMRTFLTITGISIGVASIVAILSLASGATDILTKQVNNVGGNIAVIRPGAEKSRSFEDAINSLTSTPTKTSSLKRSDVESLKELPSISDVAPLITTHVTLHSEDTNQPAVMLGTTAELFPMSHLKFQSGDFEADSEKLITVGAQLSVDLFGTEESLGKLIAVKGHTFRVGGVIKRQADPINFNGVDFDNAIIVNQSILRTIDSSAQIQQIDVRPNSVSQIDKMVGDANKTLLANHDGETNFHILTGDDIAAPTGQFFRIISSITATIAGIALFVGGVGIMNIMLVNVAERSHEIGIRKALGATNSDIAWQFLIESIILAFIGGIVGFVLGVIGAFLISLLLTFNPVITWQICLATAAVSIGIGSVFGFYPAFYAARKNPIESLQQNR